MTLLAITASVVLAGAVRGSDRVAGFNAALADAGGGDVDGVGTAHITFQPDGGWIIACGTLTARNIGRFTDWGIHVGAEGEVGDVVWGFSGTGYCVSVPSMAIPELDAMIADPPAVTTSMSTPGSSPTARFGAN